MTMGERTSIAWTDRTWNTAVGCRKVDPCCKNCYAETLVNGRMGRDFSIVTKTAPATFNAPLSKKWHEPSKVWSGPPLIFANSLSDFFIEEQDAWRNEAWNVIRRCPDLIFQILTKRPERIYAHLPRHKIYFPGDDASDRRGTEVDFDWPYPNVWIGASVGTQLGAEQRIPLLLNIPAKIRFLSVEPLLGPIDLSPWLPHTTGPAVPFNPAPLVRGSSPIQWVIIGGESGSGRREMNLEWLRSIVDQCRQADVAVFVKQDSALKPGQRGRIPDDLWTHQFPVVA